jgi:hypothetical protein
MNKYIAAIGALFCIGSIDMIENGIAHVIFTTGGAESYEADMPVELFPCTVSEGDLFYAQVLDGVMELRCGEPPE